MKCIHCGKTVADEARFCKYCGTRLRRTCVSCGAALDDDALFCASCGAEALAELDFTKKLLDLSASDTLSPTGERNDSGFYFSRRISRQNRSAAENCFDIRGEMLAFVEEQVLNRLIPGPNPAIPGLNYVRRTSDISRDIGIKDIELFDDGSVLAAGFDWGTGGEPIIMLWQYDAALNLRAATEVLCMSTGAERRTCKMRLTEKHLFIFIWDNHAEGKREIIKYGLANGKLEQKQIDGKRVDLWYVDGERIFFRGERGEGEAFFGVLDTAREPWAIRRIWTIGNGPDEIPDCPVYCDFAKGVAWTAATAAERRELGLMETTYVARALAPGHKLLKDCPMWTVPEAGAVNLFLDYFDGEHCYKANNVLAMDACDREGSKHRWKNTLHGDTENILIWGERLLADFTSHGYRIYPAALESPEDIYRDGLLVREM